MKLTRKQLRKLILKEFDSTNLNKNFIVDSPPPPNFPRGDDGGGDGESCDDYGVKWEKSYRKVMDAFNIAYPYSGGNHRVFLGYLSDSGIQLPFSADSSSKDLIDYVTDVVLSDIAMDVCNMKISGNEKYLVDLLKSPFSLLYGVDYIEIVSGKKVKKKTGTYLPNAFLKDI